MKCSHPTLTTQDRVSHIAKALYSQPFPAIGSHLLLLENEISHGTVEHGEKEKAFWEISKDP